MEDDIRWRRLSCLKGGACKRPSTGGCGGAGPSAVLPLLDDATASPASRRLAADPAALATPPHTLFQQPASLHGAGRRKARAPVNRRQRYERRSSSEGRDRSEARRRGRGGSVQTVPRPSKRIFGALPMSG